MYRGLCFDGSAYHLGGGWMKRFMDVLTLLPQMPFVKKVKNDAYFSRFQVKYRRRREGKTDCTLLCLTDEVYVTISRQITRASG
jgi:hypothetical protein